MEPKFAQIETGGVLKMIRGLIEVVDFELSVLPYTRFGDFVRGAVLLLFIVAIWVRLFG